MKEMRFENPLIDPPEAVAFTLVGVRGGQPAEERFVCLRQPPYAATQMMSMRHDVASFIRLCLQPDEEKRWDALMVDKTFSIEKQLVRDVYNALVEHYFDVPTQAPSASGSGRESTGDSSTADGGSPDSTSES